MPAPTAYRKLRLHILAVLGAGAFAAVVASACDDTSPTATDDCLDLDDPNAACPTVEEAADLLDNDSLVDFDARWPARAYRADGKRYDLPAECCYTTPSDSASDWNCNGFGRPLLVEATAVVARPERRNASWIRGNRRLPWVDHLDIATRHQLGKSWLERALAEHAAIASFSRFTSELLALGAPPDLVREACKAGAEEVDHAELCFAFAEAYRAEPWGPGALPAPLSMSGVDASDFAARLALEGCIHETIGVAELEARAVSSSDPVLRTALRRLAAEETRHAALGWRALAWIARRDEGARAAAAVVFRRFGLEVLEPDPDLAGAREHPLAAHGELSSASRQRIARACFLDVIVPAARRVCASPSAHRTSAESAA